MPARAMLVGILVVLTGAAGLAAASGKSGDGGGKTHHFTAEIIQQAFTGNASSPKLGDEFVVSTDVFDDAGTKVGRSGSFCTVVSVPPRPTERECMVDVVLPEGKITVGGLAPFPATSNPTTYSILGGTGLFRKARGEVVVFPVPPDKIDITIRFAQ